MDMIAELFAAYGKYLWFIAVISVVVFVHEYGHYIVGRWCGIEAQAFSLGMGPELFAWTDRRGTRWRLAAFPIGGYVKYVGDLDGSSRADEAAMARMDAATRARSFHGASVGARALAVAAGPVFNFIFAILVFAGLGMWFGQAQQSPVVGSVVTLPGLETGLRPGDRILSIEGTPVETLSDFYRRARELPAEPVAVEIAREGERIAKEIPYPLPPLVGNVQPFSAAWRAGLKQGDLILTLDGAPVASFEALRETVMASEGKPVAVRVQRGAEVVEMTMSPRMVDEPDGQGGFRQAVRIGVALDYVVGPEIRTPSIPDALWLGVSRTWEVISTSISGIWHLVTQQISASNMMGPLGIAQLSGEMASQGAEQLIGLLAVLSVAIGTFNLLPIPILDGGHLLFLAIEKIKGSRPEGRWVDYANTLGFALIVGIALMATRFDIPRWLGLDG